jgi:hypothetical protein
MIPTSGGCKLRSPGFVTLSGFFVRVLLSATALGIASRKARHFLVGASNVLIGVYGSKLQIRP